MSSSPPGESPLTQHQPCLDALVIAAEQAAISSLRQPNRAYLKSSIVRPKVSHATLSKHRRRYREYPTEAAYHGRSSTLRKSRTFNLAPKSSSLANGEVETTQTKTPIGSNGRDDAVNAADSKLACSVGPISIRSWSTSLGLKDLSPKQKGKSQKHQQQIRGGYQLITTDLERKRPRLRS
jgi:hypothetical protein